MTGRPTAASAASAMADTQIGIVEVSPRDGLQNEARILPAASKAELLQRCCQAGARRIEAVSFARPSLVPQMADAEAVMAAVMAVAPRPDGVSYIGLVLNERGLDRALTAGVDEINVVVPVTDSFCQRNQGTSVSGLVKHWAAIAPRARSAGLRVTATIAVAFGCPFEGPVGAAAVTALAGRLAESPLDELALADTIGIGTPELVTRTAGAVADAVPGLPLRAHFHDTYGRGIANALAAVRSGIRVLDASAGGVGGCPFAPGAAGNVATEDLVAALHDGGAVTSIDVGRMAAAGAWLRELLGKPRTVAKG